MDMRERVYEVIKKKYYFLNGNILNLKSSDLEFNRDRFTELKDICTTIGIDFELVKEYDSLFKVIEYDDDKWFFLCNVENFLDIVIPILRDKRFSVILDK